MKEFTITGWEESLKTISLIKYVRVLKDLDLKQAKQAVESMLEGSPFMLGQFDDQTVQEIESTLDEVKTRCQVIDLQALVIQPAASLRSSPTLRHNRLTGH